jgi:hypothetical protein
MLRTTLCVVGSLWALSSAASTTPVDQEAFGCQSMANATQLLTLRQAGDVSDYEDRLHKLVRAGECRVWTAADAVTVEDQGDGLVCFAPSGARNRCYWSAPGFGPQVQP